MTLAELLDSVFSDAGKLTPEGGLLMGPATLKGGTRVAVIGLHGGVAPGVDEAVQLSRYVLSLLDTGEKRPVLVLVDSGSQRMSKRDELLGLSEALAHLAKCLIWADTHGWPVYSVLYGHAAAGAFLASALAARELLATSSAYPEVMDLASMSKVTKLSLEVLQQKARSTPVFAPGVDNLFSTGGVAAICEADALATTLTSLIRAAMAPDATPAPHPGSGFPPDIRDRLGRERGGRPKALDIAQKVHDLVIRTP